MCAGRGSVHPRGGAGLGWEEGSQGSSWDPTGMPVIKQWRPHHFEDLGLLGFEEYGLSQNPVAPE